MENKKDIIESENLDKKNLNNLINPILFKEDEINLTQDCFISSKESIYEGVYEFSIDILESSMPSSSGWDISLLIYNNNESVGYVMKNKGSISIKILNDFYYSFFNATYGDIKFKFTIKKFNNIL